MRAVVAAARIQTALKTVFPTSGTCRRNCLFLERHASPRYCFLQFFADITVDLAFYFKHNFSCTFISDITVDYYVQIVDLRTVRFNTFISIFSIYLSLRTDRLRLTF
jgi:hypothetical protein